MNPLILHSILCLVSVFYTLAPQPISILQAKPDQQWELNRALIDAIEKNDLTKVTSLLAQGASVNAKGINDTALQTAIFEQNVEISRLLLSKGAKIENQDLADAARCIQGDQPKAIALVNLLLTYMDREAARNGRAHADLVKEGPDALVGAASCGNFVVLNLLLRRGAPVNSKDRNGEPPLFSIVAFDQLEAVRKL